MDGPETKTREALSLELLGRGLLVPGLGRAVEHRAVVVEEVLWSLV